MNFFNEYKINNSNIYQSYQSPINSNALTNVNNLQSILRTVKQLRVGGGEKSVNIGPEGLWIGGTSFANAPVKITLRGSLIVTDENGKDIVILGNLDIN